MLLFRHGQDLIMAQLHIAEAVFHTLASASGRNRILSRYGFMSSKSRLPDTKSTCKTWLGSGVTAVRYLRFKCVPSFPQK